ncbi:hypothetical protein FZEAL_5904 [Fusarium zealandicum]|uniref:Uncharacterized protein n=1 Tax=Fusarium zealandicum TaxID=1053134 RepID=A0A8H4UJB9_9HYPO|nr:hypothetical protein FZEAL_5904 [Fusarium zealandicum]
MWPEETASHQVLLGGGGSLNLMRIATLCKLASSRGAWQEELAGLVTPKLVMPIFPTHDPDIGRAVHALSTPATMHSWPHSQAPSANGPVAVGVGYIVLRASGEPTTCRTKITCLPAKRGRDRAFVTGLELSASM